MEAIDWSALARLVPEVIIVLIFVVFTQQKEKTDTLARRERDEMWLKFLSAEQDRARDFLKEEREHRSTWAGRVSEEIKSVGLVMTTLSTLIREHDLYSRELSLNIDRQVMAISKDLERSFAQEKKVP